MLDNISVTIATLESFNPRICDLKFENQVSFDDIISRAKTKVYTDVKDDYISEYSYLTNSEIDTALAKVKDLPQEQFLKERIAKLAIAEIYLINEDREGFLLWKEEAYNVPLKYYIDADDSSTAGLLELRKAVTLPGFRR